MDNKKILFFLFSLFFMLPFTTNALSYSVNEKEYQVTDVESLRDYCYFTVNKPGIESGSRYFNYLIVYEYRPNDDNPIYGCLTQIRSSFSGEPNFYLNSSYLYFGKDSTTYKFDIYQSDSIFSHSTLSGRVSSALSTSVLFSNSNVCDDSSCSNVLFNSNFTFEDIENKYTQSSEPTEPTEPSDDEKNDFIISKEEYYLLLMLLSLLIWLLYFKWCFPMKGGKKI